MTAVPSPTLAALTIKVEVLRGRDLIAKDRNVFGKRSTSDAYGVVYLGAKKLGKTKVAKKTLSPVWNETFEAKFGADDASKFLRGGGGGGASSAQSVEVRLFDHDLSSSDDPMGTVRFPVDFKGGGGGGGAQWYRVGKGSGRYHCHNAKGDVEIRLTIAGQQMREVTRGTYHALKHNRITVGLAWDVERGRAVDLDSSVVAIDRNGSVLLDECVYYGNLSNRNRSVVHSGDETTGEASGDDETIRIELDRVPSNVVALYFLLTVCSQGRTFADVRSAKARFVSTDTKVGICRFVPSEMGRDNTALFLVRMSRDPSSSRHWNLTPIEEGNPVARDFGSLVPEIKGYTRDLVPHIQIDPTERVAIMRKGGTIRVSDFVPGHVLPPTVTFGLAWDITNGRNIDLDASAIMLDDELNNLDIVFFNKLTSTDGSVRHSGDEREGDEVGDDEKISVTLDRVDVAVKYIGFVVNSYSGQELDDVSKASCHLFDPGSHAEIAKYAMSNTRALDKHTALVMGCLYRFDSVGGAKPEWHLRIISEAAQGKTAHANVDELQNFWRRNPPQAPQAVPEPEIVLTEMPDATPMDEEIVVVPMEDLGDYAGGGQKQQGGVFVPR